jgi:hypothetical protein
MRNPDLALLQAILDAARDYEAKANFNPYQPRVPGGSPRGGEWTKIGKPLSTFKEIGNIWRGWEQEVDWDQMEIDARRHSREVEQFIARNRSSILRVLGALQLAGASVEIIAGVTGAVAGASTSEIGVGIPLVALSAWMVTNGYDNFLTGWRALLTGSPQETNLHVALRRLGLSDDQATATEILLAGNVTAGGGRLARPALLEAAEVGLARRAAQAFATEPLNVRAGVLRIWDEPRIQVRGDAWEAFDAARTGFERTPYGFGVFDQFHRPSGVAISNKTLDLALSGYSRSDRNAVYNTVAGYIDQVHVFRMDRVGDFRILASEIRQRRLHLLLPAGEALPGQALQLAAAEQYAASRGVILQVEYAR